MQGGVDVFKDVGNGVIKSVVFGVAVTFIACCRASRRSPPPRACPAPPPARWSMASLAVLALDFVLTAMMFSI
jgi:phospholipid/cholesterol/gamma-HCH transport system permease protein